jgi:uncharacterized protein
MDQRGAVKEWCARVGRAFPAQRIILFGSRASGTAHADSDFDLLVVMPLRKNERAAQKAAAIRNQIHASFPMDLIIRSPEEIQQRVAAGDSFIKGVLSRGVVLYEAEHP